MISSFRDIISSAKALSLFLYTLYLTDRTTWKREREREEREREREREREKQRERNRETEKENN